MRKLAAIILAASVLAGCGATVRQFPRQTSVSLLDFRPFTEAGFFFSADPYQGTYEPIGQMLIEIIPAKGPGGFEDPDSGELLELAYKEATERGANGVASLSMSTEETFVTIDDIRKPSGGGKYSDAVYPSASGSPVTIPVRKIKISGTLIRIQR